MVDHSKLLDLKYSRLVESRRFSNQPSLPEKQRRVRSEKKQPNRPEKPNLPILSTSDCAFQVVVMRVSLHCQGCAGKVKKHISKMEGVTSFSIDLESKRVTVMGHVSRVEVLESISKVKKAEFWPAAASDLC